MTMLVQWEDYAGLGEAKTAIQILPLFLGQALCVADLFVDHGRKRYEHRFWFVAITNLLGESLVQVCIAVAGSSVFVVLYSSVTIFAALIKRFYLKKQFTYLQWIGISLIVGLALSEVKDFGNGKSLSNTLIGIFCGLGSALFYA